ncbi:TRAP transporter substrate-binding protein [Fodinisporobacter ferrooxydans]|uniref:TRAP transporter substrate-binding protein n=1 Tax=Fodinisporobacter ferrooxydans TaxID=2901836 RepID=A0ABY4CTA4_9BACL|nr:TRAP transporter substrate-binding protein [Alicyclobacillaceae bacterium MYW30-H2]
MKKLNGFAPDNTPRGAATSAFIEHVEKKSNGRLKIETFPMEMYGTESTIIQAVQTGTLDMQIVGANILANTIPQFAALSLPLLTQSIDEGCAVLDGPAGNRLQELGEEHGFKVLADVALGYAQITNNVRPINSPDDLLGMKMRSPDEYSFIETFKALGASVTTLDYTKLYTSLAEGVIDGQFNPLFNIFDLNIDDVQDYLAMTNHTYYVAFIIMNKNVFDGLAPELQQIILEAGNKARHAARKYVGDHEKDLLEKAKRSFKEITYPEMKPFQKKIQPVYAKMEEVIGAEIVHTIQEFLTVYRREKAVSV